jgi:hypothetical protein
VYAIPVTSLSHSLAGSSDAGCSGASAVGGRLPVPAKGTEAPPTPPKSSPPNRSMEEAAGGAAAEGAEKSEGATGAAAAKCRGAAAGAPAKGTGAADSEPNKSSPPFVLTGGAGEPKSPNKSSVSAAAGAAFDRLVAAVRAPLTPLVLSD